MLDKNALCEKIRSLYPEIGSCGIDIDLTFDNEKQVWTVDLKKDAHQLKTHLEVKDATLCMEGEQCIYLGAQISQLVENIKKV